MIRLTIGHANTAILMLADATGHGIGPALSATQTRAMLRMTVRMEGRLPKIARHMNEQLVADLPSGRFVTAWLGVLDTNGHTISSFSAGQAPLLRYHAAEARFEVFRRMSPPLVSWWNWTSQRLIQPPCGVVIFSR